jgi:hypothetical protein
MWYSMRMTCSRDSANPRRSSVMAVVMTGLSVLSTMALVTTCDFPPTFGAEYKDSSTNFIEALPLSSPPDASDFGVTVPPDIALDALATWDWAWRAQTGNTYPYMNFVDQGSGTGPGGTGNAWFLETVNLAVNPAFAGALTTGWGASGATLNGTGVIHNNALFANCANDNQYIYIDRNSFIDPLDATTGHTYSLAMNASGIVGLEYLESLIAEYSSLGLYSTGWNGTGPYYTSLSSITSTSTRVVAFNNSNTAFLFDDISAIRTDIDARKWALVLRLGLEDTEPSLVPGTYEFSVYVKRPPTHTFNTDASRGDNVNYAARFVTLRLTQIAGGSTPLTVAVQNYEISALADPDSWNLLTLRMPSGSNFTFPESTTGGAIELSISPIDPSRPEAGAVLIANPSLHFYIDGY